MLCPKKKIGKDLKKRERERNKKEQAGEASFNRNTY